MRAVTDDVFTATLERLRSISVRPEFTLFEAPAPQRLAPDAVAITAEAVDDDDTDGRFVLLHDPDGHEEWGGNFRVVVFTRSAIDEDVVLDPLLPDVAWSWVQECLDDAGVGAEAIGGTVTRNLGQSFGTLTDREGERLIEVRASWTPVFDEQIQIPEQIDGHVRAWIGLLAQVGGYPKLADDVAHLRQRQH
jgi:hypothetical protein